MYCPYFNDIWYCNLELYTDAAKTQNKCVVTFSILQKGWKSYDSFVTIFTLSIHKIVIRWNIPFS